MRLIPRGDTPDRMSRATDTLAGGALLVLAAALLAGPPAAAQTGPNSPRPYASINRDAVNYSGPGREAARDLRGDDVTIGLLLPLRGAQEAEGKALLQAAQVALEDEAATPLPGGRRLALAVRDESGPWGRAGSEIVRLIFDDRAVALITSTDGAAAHLAEQIANKAGVPVLTLSTDRTTTEINLPWIFRLGPTDTAQAQAFAQHIYRQRALRKVLLLAERDHDGRVGGEEFEKAARQLQAPRPHRLEIVPAAVDLQFVLAQMEAISPEAIVLWTGPESAAKLLPPIRRARPSAAIYLCQKAAQAAVERAVISAPFATTAALPAKRQSGAGIWMGAFRSSALEAVRENFEQHYRARMGTMPSITAAQAYDAVRVIAAALRQAGPNRARLRDRLAAGTSFPGISFDGAGNALGDVVLVELHEALP